LFDQYGFFTYIRKELLPTVNIITVNVIAALAEFIKEIDEEMKNA